MQVAASAIVHDRDGAAGLLVERFDRQRDANGLKLLAVEDACQAMGLWPADKYNATMEESSRALMALTPAATVAARDILRQLTLAWLTGNGDLHAKNISVLDSSLVGQRIAPAYDLPSTLFYDDTVLALSVGGKETLSASRLITFAREIGLPAKAIARTVGELISATSGLGDALIAAALPFEGRAMAKVVRQLETRHREIAKALPALEALE
jgi:serine/threonine-protein kinase HipA